LNASASPDASDAPPWRERDGCLALTVRLTPKSARDEIEGVGLLSDGRPVLKARVRAVPEDGAANAALIKLIAKALRLPAAAVRLESGGASRLKTIVLTGDPKAHGDALAAFLGASARR
jgi:uncharacterized protein (TIGR00251 family)